jgi:hypothetical protein
LSQAESEGLAGGATANGIGIGTKMMAATALMFGTAMMFRAL